MGRNKKTSPTIAFGKAVRKMRLRKNISQEELAHRAEIHRTYLSDIECGKRNPTIITMHRLAIALDCPLHKLTREMETFL